MSTNSEEASFRWMGRFSVWDARALIEGLESAGIEYRADFVTEPNSVYLEGDSGETQIDVIAEEARFEEAMRVQGTIFGQRCTSTLTPRSTGLVEAVHSCLPGSLDAAPNSR